MKLPCQNFYGMVIEHTEYAFYVEKQFKLKELAKRRLDNIYIMIALIEIYAKGNRKIFCIYQDIP